MTPTPRPSRFALLAAAALGSVFLGTAGIAAAQSDSSPSSDPPAAAAAAEERRPPRGDRAPLAEDTAAKVESAALAAAPGGTVEHVKAGRRGTAYVAHVVKADGTHVRVKLDDAFTVTAVEEGSCDKRGPAPAGAAAAQA